MAELVDALVSEASEETHGSSSLLGHTKRKLWHLPLKANVFYLYLNIKIYKNSFLLDDYKLYFVWLFSEDIL